MKYCHVFVLFTERPDIRYRLCTSSGELKLSLDKFVWYDYLTALLEMYPTDFKGPFKFGFKWRPRDRSDGVDFESSEDVKISFV